MSVQVRAGDTEPIEAMVRDSAGRPLPGKTDIVASIRRLSDSLTYDWLDGAWRAFASCTTPRGAMVEVDAGNYPGQYRTTFVAPAGDDIYQVTVDQHPRTDAANVPQPGEIRVGAWASTIEVNRKLLNNRQELGHGATNNLKTYDDDDVTVIATSSVTDVDGNAISLDAGVPARRSRGA